MKTLNFPWVLGEILMRPIHYHLIGVLSLLSQLQTPVSLVADYSKYPRSVAGGISNCLVSTLPADPPPKQYFHANPARYAD